MPPTSPTTISILFCLFVTVLTHDLDCDFSSKCCWSGDDSWQIKNRSDFNINEFRRTFLVGRSKPPPADNYIVRVESDGAGNYTSCPLCSSDGAVLVQFRHWQSPTARLRLCYRSLHQKSAKECQLALSSRQSQVISYLFRVPRAQKIQLFFSAESTEASSGSVVMIDRIRVQFTDCHTPETTMIPPRPSKRKFVQPARREQEEETVMTISDSSMNQGSSRISHQTKRPMHMKKVKKVTAKDTTIQTVAPPHSAVHEIQQEVTAPVSQPIQPIDLSSKNHNVAAVPHHTEPKSPAIPPAPAVGVNPLNDLLGEQLANFLDPNYVTNDDETEPDEEDSIDNEIPSSTVSSSVLPLSSTVTQRPIDDHMPTHATAANVSSNTVSGSILVPGKPVKVERPNPLSEFHRPLPVGVPTACETVGGCLFERGFCSWKPPSDVPTHAQFQLQRVGHSTFAYTKVPSGELSMIEVETQMRENHTIVFDALEWQVGSRLIGCCSINSELHCPFATPSEAGHLIWQISKFECPTNTSKIIFICENFGAEEATCGIDNIRLHRSTDIFFFEPCQKNTLSSL